MSTLHMFVKDFAQLLVNKIAEEETKMGRGHCTSYDEYQKRVGVVSGLNAARNAALDMFKATQQDLDDLETPVRRTA